MAHCSPVVEGLVLIGFVTDHDAELSSHTVVEVVARVIGNEDPYWVEVRVGASGEPPPEIEYSTVILNW